MRIAIASAPRRLRGPRPRRGVRDLSSRAAGCVPGMVLPLFLFPHPAWSQADSWKFDIQIGSLDHTTDLNRYHRMSFDNGAVLGVGASSRITDQLSGRFSVEMAQPHLSGPDVFDRSGYGQENLLLTAQLQLVGTTQVGRLEPFAGVGLGVRRYSVNSYILTDDIVHAPWARPQHQPIGSLSSGLRFAISSVFSVAAEARWFWTRFRVAPDTWGLPGDPVQTQREFQPALRLELSPH